jgi:hypothetical protein
MFTTVVAVVAVPLSAMNRPSHPRSCRYWAARNAFVPPLSESGRARRAGINVDVNSLRRLSAAQPAVREHTADPARLIHMFSRLPRANVRQP